MKKLLLTAVLALGALGICISEASAQDGWYYRGGMGTWGPSRSYYVYPASYTYSTPVYTEAPVVVTNGYSTTPWVTTRSYYYGPSTYAYYPTYPTTYYYPTYSYYRPPVTYTYSYPVYYRY